MNTESTITIPEMRHNLSTDPVLQDPRLDYLVGQVATRWRNANRELAGARKGDNPRTKDISDGFAQNYLGYAAELHCKRALKALRAGKPMPHKTTGTQQADGLRDEDLPELNLLIRQTIGQHILQIAGALGECAVLFSDPAKVAELVQI